VLREWWTNKQMLEALSYLLQSSSKAGGVPVLKQAGVAGAAADVFPRRISPHDKACPNVTLSRYCGCLLPSPSTDFPIFFDSAP
jgi:hypothetical protein